jgi:lysophospholipase L1-like esterase
MTASGTARKPAIVLRFLKDAAIVIGVSVALVLIAELFLRAFFPQRLEGTSLRGQRFSVRDEVLGMRYVPGAIWRFTHPEYEVEYAINADGFRDAREHPVPKPNGTVRMLVLGDSFTFGQGANYEDTWPVLIERQFERVGNHRIDVVKAGMQSMDTRSEFLLMQELVKKYDADVIVVGFLINDLYANSLYGIEQEQLTLVTSAENGTRDDAAESWFRTMKNTFVRNDRGGTFHLLNLSRRTLLANDSLYCRLYIASARGDFMSEPWKPEVSEQVKITETLFKKMHEYAQSNGKQLIVLSIPQQFQVLYLEEYPGSREVDVAAFDRYFAGVARRHGFAWINSLESFAQAKEDPAKLFYRWDGHLTPAGNRVVADVFTRQIVPLLTSVN